MMELVAAGKMNKQVAGDLKLSEITVKIHRGRGDAEDGRPHPGRPGAHAERWAWAREPPRRREPGMTSPPARAPYLDHRRR
ncbi:MAG: LuxR C-terminal-related transcriptional regulator [Caulobacteraceae bacterium]